jgi:hypothetical protein
MQKDNKIKKGDGNPGVWLLRRRANCGMVGGPRHSPLLHRCLMGALGAASSGPEWTSPLEVRAAVSCWRQHSLADQQCRWQLLVAGSIAGCNVGFTLGGERLQCHTGGCKSVGGPAVLMAAAGCMVGRTSSIVGGCWLLGWVDQQH